MVSWTTVSKEHDIYVVDLGLTPKSCDELVTTTEQECRGRYAAYTYAKQTLGCKEYPVLARAALGPVHSMVGAIIDRFDGMGPDARAKAATAKLAKEKIATPKATTQVPTETETHLETETQTAAQTDSSQDKTKKSSSTDSNDTNKNDASRDSPIIGDNKPADRNHSIARTTTATSIVQKQVLQLDDREPHIVKYDITKKERQKLDMHTDKSEWTFLIALSNGCGLDYEGGGTYFECLDATVHVQKGHALVFPGKLRHKGQAIHHGLRFLLVGFLVDKGGKAAKLKAATAASAVTATENENAKVVVATANATSNSKVSAAAVTDLPHHAGDDARLMEDVDEAGPASSSFVPMVAAA